MADIVYTDKDSNYLKQNPSWHVEDSPWKAEQILKMIERNDIHPKSVAEIGCGVGEILNSLHKKMPEDVNFQGFDISPDAINLAKERAKERLSFRLENLIEVQETFDLLLMIDVFEHVEDYIGFIKSCKGKAKYTIFHIPLDLSVHGLLRGKLMNARKVVGHLHYFSKETALATLADSGYEVVDYFYTGKSIELPRKTLKSKLAVLPRKIMYGLNKDFTARTMGGFSLLVLVK